MLNQELTVMTLKMHHIAPKCILFFKKFSGVIPSDPLKRGGERGGEGKGKDEGEGERGKGMGEEGREGRGGKGRRAGRMGGRKWEGWEGKLRASSLFETNRRPCAVCPLQLSGIFAKPAAIQHWYISLQYLSMAAI
jgi:hypothetical protein